MNIIHRLTLDLNFFSNTVSIPALNNEIDLVFKERIVKVLNDVVGDMKIDHNLFIDKIEIDLKLIGNENSLEKDLKDQLELILKDHLQNGSLKDLNGYTRKTSKTNNIKNEEDINSVLMQDPQIKESIVEFLKTGSFNWNILEEGFRKDKSYVTEFLRQSLKSEMSYWLKIFQDHPAAFIRIMIYFKECSGEMKLLLLQNIKAHRKDFTVLFSYLADLPASELALFNLENIKEILSYLNLQVLSEIEQVALLIFFILIVLPEKSAANFKRETKIDLQDLKGMINKIVKPEIPDTNVVTAFKLFLNKEGLSLSDEFYKKLEDSIAKENPFIPQMKLPASYEKEELLHVKPVEKEISGSFTILNAGIVILHPFLPHLFTALKLLSGGEFKNDQSRFKAVQLLHFLCTLEAGFSESDIVFLKIICGVSIQQPFALGSTLTKKEKKECRALLEAVIKQWDVLKNTSPEGLIETYIKRQGILITENNEITLGIEKKAVDILLQRLPWTISIIKFSWLKKMICVNWH